MKKPKILRPTEAPAASVLATDLFLAEGWQPDDAHWLAPVCLRTLAPKEDAVDGVDDVTEHNLKTLAGLWKSHGTRDRALMSIYARLCGCGGTNTDAWPGRTHSTGRSRPGSAEWRALACEFRADRAHAKGVDFEGVLVSSGWPGDYPSTAAPTGDLHQFVRDHSVDFYKRPDIARLMHTLVYDAGLDLTRVLDDSQSSPLFDRFIPHPTLPLRVPKNRDPAPLPVSNPRLLINWMIGLGPAALTKAFPVLQRQPDSMIGYSAFGFRDAIERWLRMRGDHDTDFRAGGFELADAMIFYVDELERRTQRSPDDLSIRRAWLWFVWGAISANPNLATRDKERTERVLRAATEDLAHLRRLFAHATPKGEDAGLRGEGWGHVMPESPRAPWEEFEWERDHFQTCISLLFHFGGLWRGMKALLLALRSLEAPALAQDLRYWREPDRPNPPEPWTVIPATMITLLHAYASTEESQDPELMTLRGNLGTFCLERIVDRWSKEQRNEAAESGGARKDSDMVEPSPIWRECLIRAFSNLGVNPEGKGHRALNASARIDPDHDVRAAAHDASQRLRRADGLPEGVSPRRAILSALWWIRQAHLLDLQARYPELGIQLDEDGAQRTRIKELTRTKEAERANKP